MYKITVWPNKEPTEHKSVLDALSEGRVFEVQKINGLYRFQEACDDNFDVHLTKDQVIDLANELLTLAYDE